MIAPPLDVRPPAQAWRRVAARSLDVVTVVTVLWVLVVLRVAWFVPGLTGRVAPAPWGRAFVVTICFVVLAVAYEAVFVSRSAGQTPGMDVMGIRVIGPGEDHRVGPARAAVRVAPVAVIPLLRPAWAAIALAAAFLLAAALAHRRPFGGALTSTRVVPFDRDREDPMARRPSSRHRRRAMARDEPLHARRSPAFASTSSADRPHP